MHVRQLLLLVVAVSLLVTATHVSAAGERSYEIDLSDLPKAKKPATRPPASRKAPPVRKQRAPRPTVSEAIPAGFTTYTVKPGDHIFKILHKEFGLSNRQAEALIPEIIRRNAITNIKGLKVGQTLLIPSAASAATHASSRTLHRSPATPAPTAAAPETTAAAMPPASQEPITSASTAPQTREQTAITEVPLTAPLPPVFPAPVDIHFVTAREPEGIFDGFLEILDLKGEKNKIVESGKESDSSTFLSIKVDRYLEHRGVRYIVTFGEKDPFNYTLLRLLETAGYRVIRFGRGDDFRAIGSGLLDALQWPYTYGKHQLKLVAGAAPAELSGFMLVTSGGTPRQLLITDTVVEGTPPDGGKGKAGS